MKPEIEKMQLLLRAVRDAYERGENAMAVARDLLGENVNDPVATLLSYDLQTGNYNAWARKHEEEWMKWSKQTADLITPHLPASGSILEVGCGEARTLGGVLRLIGESVGCAYGFDISWSRVDEGRAWLKELNQTAGLYVADLMNIPMADDSVDVVYSSHSLEPNGGREAEAVKECLRVAKHALVLVEPLYELGSEEQQERMRSHGYIRGLREAAESLGATVKDFRLLDFALNPMNPSGVMIIEKGNGGESAGEAKWQCPLSGAAMSAHDDVYYADELGMAYPVLRNVPMLRAEHAIVASKLK